MRQPFRYRIVVEWSAEDKCYLARVPALPGCATHGDTPEEATREALFAAKGILESMKEHGDAVPPEDAVADYSGQLRLRLPRTLHEKLARLATAEGVSLNQELVTLLAERGAKAKVRRKKTGKSGPSRVAGKILRVRRK